MYLLYILGALCFTVSAVSASTPCAGCVSIDEHSYEKILPRFEVTVLKFDNSYPYGDKHNNFVKVAGELADNNDIIIGHVGVKYYGEKDNQEFAKKFGVNSQDDFPVLKLFVRGEDEPFTYSKNSPWTEEDIKKFIRDHTNIYLGLPGCLEAFDKLSVKFATSSDKESVLKEAEQAVQKLKVDKEKKAANIYIKFMKKQIESSISFVAQEVKRLNKILSGKVSAKKKEELSQRLNILRAFEIPSSVKTEL